MNNWLAEMYGTGGQATDGAEGSEKVAQLELFAKLAADEGIDLTQLEPSQVNELYAETFAKAASDDGDEDDEGGDSDVEEKAKAEHEEKKEGAAKLAEAELMGQVMAHSFVSELNEIQGGDAEKMAAMPEALAKGLAAAGKAGKAVAGAAGKAGAKVKEKGKAVGKFYKEPVAQASKYQKKLTDPTTRNLQNKLEYKGVRNRAAGTAAKRIGGTAAGVGAVGGGAAAATKGRKEASAFDLLAAQNAVKLAATSGYDEEQAVDLINAVYTLGLGDSEKVAFIEDTADAIHVRSLEYLEGAGYDVNWEEVFGQ